MKTHALVLLCAVTLLSGCYLNAHLYPVTGPLAAETAPPIYSARITGALNSGSMKVTLASGEVCQGDWSLVSRSQPSSGAAEVNWAAVWDAVYGSGFYNANVLGEKLHVRGTLTGSKGTTLNVELYRRDVPGQMTEIHGVAEDNDGNIYKVAI